MLGWISLIGEALKLVNTLNDPEKRRAAYELHLDKKAKKALEAAESFILAYDSFKAGVIEERAWKYLYKKYKKRFFSND